MTRQNTAAPIHDICPPVAAEYGFPPDIELMAIDGHGVNSVANAIVDQLEATHSRTPDGSDIENGSAANRAVTAFKCGECALHGTCQVEKGLEDAVKYKEATTRLNSISNMLVLGSSWLTKGRIGHMISKGLKPTEINRLFSHPNELTDSALSGSLDVDDMRGGVKNELIGFEGKHSIPEISKSEHFDEKTMYPVERITTDTGHVFDVIDASIGNKHKEATIPETEHIVLAHKLLNMISTDDSNGHPQIFNAEGKKLSVIHSVTPPKGSHYYEVRMAGKNRMYISVTRGNQDEPSRIVIFGAHGGDEQTQNRFISTLLNSRPTASIPTQRTGSRQSLKTR